jgi:hypothetical protein
MIWRRGKEIRAQTRSKSLGGKIEIPALKISFLRRVPGLTTYKQLVQNGFQVRNFSSCARLGRIRISCPSDTFSALKIFGAICVSATWLSR